MTDPVPQPSATALPVVSESAPAPYRPGYEVIAERILDLISDRALSVGDRLPTERELAELLGVSRTVTREAIKILSALGRISVRKGSGLFVARAEVQLASATLSHFHPTEAAQVQMLFDFRRLVESESARQAAQVAMPRQVVELHAAARRCTAAAAADDYREFGAQDREFHLALAAAANNMFILNGVETARVYVDQVATLLFHDRAPGSLVVAALQHQRIADAVAAGERDVAVAVMIDHIDTTQSQLSRRIRERLISITPEGSDQ